MDKSSIIGYASLGIIASMILLLWRNRKSLGENICEELENFLYDIQEYRRKHK